ncbi:hypothetical protein ACRALDRAFT_1082460 [Sodiomyces alcalophilus JCM 7366]|uniref:uncharacterized protein n=1 Tax=Sodiomyces alcalophilus JCM 7366 TaxID=591952 RepID=UPI0039B4EDB3
MADDDEIPFPPGFGVGDVVAWGTTGLVVLDTGQKQPTVIKTSFDESSRPAIERERQIYTRLKEYGTHDGILSYHGDVGDAGIRLEYACNHDLKSYIQTHGCKIDTALHWIIQLAEALDFVHRAGIIHGDLTTANVFLNDDLQVKLADFAGSSIDSLPLLVAITPSSEYPGDLLSPQGDLFAFGSLAYELLTGERPYATLSEAQIRARYEQQDFPDVTSLGSIGRVIRSCWEGGYHNSQAVANDLKGKCSFPNFLSSDSRRTCQDQR